MTKMGLTLGGEKVGSRAGGDSVCRDEGDSRDGPGNESKEGLHDGVRGGKEMKKGPRRRSMGSL